jgi:hypothetical protein
VWKRIPCTVAVYCKESNTVELKSLGGVYIAYDVLPKKLHKHLWKQFLGVKPATMAQRSAASMFAAASSSSSSNPQNTMSIESVQMPKLKETQVEQWDAERMLFDRTYIGDGMMPPAPFPRDQLAQSDAASRRGEPVAYTFTRMKVTGTAFSAETHAARDVMEAVAATCPTHDEYCATNDKDAQRFNFVLLSRMVDGEDSIGWHRDAEAELVPPVCSLSLGATRKFQFREEQKHHEKRAAALDECKLDTTAKQCKRFSIGIPLPDNCCVMFDELANKCMQHQVGKEKRVKTARVNFTFRTIITKAEKAQMNKQKKKQKQKQQQQQQKKK